MIAWASGGWRAKISSVIPSDMPPLSPNTALRVQITFPRNPLRAVNDYEFQGTLVSDFWGPYHAVLCAARQKCLVHLLRDMHSVDHYRKGGSDWPDFAKRLRRLIGDAFRLGRDKGNLPAESFVTRRQRLTERLDELLAPEWEDRQARRLIKRLRRHRDELFTFLDKPRVPFDNISPSVRCGRRRSSEIIRKNSYANRSQHGADVQAVLMTIYRTLKQRGHNPLQTTTDALRSGATRRIGINLDPMTGRIVPLVRQCRIDWPEKKLAALPGSQTGPFKATGFPLISPHRGTCLESGASFAARPRTFAIRKAGL